MVLAYRANPEAPGTSVTSHAIADTILSVREAQRATAVALRVWLAWPSNLSKQRLAAAMDTERDLFDLVFNPDDLEPRPKHNPDPIIPRSPKKPSPWPSGERKLSDQQRHEIVVRWEAGETMTDIARSYDVVHSTVSRLCHPRPKHPRSAV
jgi:Helix-turn-helix domain